jgi:hypothetical protein
LQIKKQELRKSKMDQKVKRDIPEEYQGIFNEIVKLIDSFCQKYLNEDYRELCEDMATALCINDFPLDEGRPVSWASGIVHALGWVNFLQDRTQSPHMTSAQLAEGFGVSQGTMMAKSKTIRDELDLMPFDPDWCLPALLEDNPLVWMVSVDGFIMDARYAPRQIQEEAYRLGLIPFIPADQQKPKVETGAKGKIIKFPIQQQNSLKPESAHEQQKDVPQLFEGLDK